VDFRLFDKILTGIKFRVQAAFNRGGDSFVYLDDFTCHPVNSRFQLSETQDDPKGLVKINTNQANNTFINEALPTNPFVDYVQNEYVKINITPTVEFTASINNAAITTSAPHGLNVGNASIVYYDGRWHVYIDHILRKRHFVLQRNLLLRLIKH